MEQTTIKTSRKLLMISTDRSIFEAGSAVRARQIEYAKAWDEVHIVVFARRNFQFPISNFQISSNSQNSNESAIAPNCWAYSTRSRFKLLYPLDAISLGKFIIEKRGITEITTQDASLTAMAGVSLKKRFNLPLEIQIHEDIGSPYYPFNITNKIRKALALSYIPKADSIRVVSERIRKYLIETVGIDSNKISIRPIAVDTDSIKSTPIVPSADLHRKYPRFKKIVLMASRLEKEKNIPLALEAFKEVLKKIPDAGLVIVGKGSQKAKLERLARRLELIGVANVGDAADFNASEQASNPSGSIQPFEPQAGESVIFEDWADKATLVSYYKTADLFLNISLFEGYGMALAEAQAAGCKIVSTNVGVAPEVGAIIVEPNIESVSVAIISQIS